MNVEQRIVRSIKRSTGNIVLRADLARFGSSSQISEVLRSLQEKEVLVRIGTGVYAKTRKSSVTGATVPSGSLETLAMEALQKLGVVIQEGTAASKYNAGKTTQLPGVFVANTGRRRIQRKIAVGGRAVVYENNFTETEARA